MNIARQVGQLGLQAWSRPYYGSLQAPTYKEQALIDELRSGLAAKPIVSSNLESDAARLWANFQETLRNRILTRDPREFLSWDVITRTMFVAFSSYAAKELAHLRRRADWSSRWCPAIRESKVGRPAPFLLYPRTSANLIHDAYTLCSFEEHTGVSLDEFHEVLEFGGGYGSMCRLFFNLGFRGRYIIYDLPLFSSLQAYFLKSLAIPVDVGDSISASEERVVLVSAESELLPHLRREHGRSSLFIAAWSISETPLEVRRNFLPHVAAFDAFLIAFQSRFGEMDNGRFFDEWREETSGAIDWRRVPIPQIRGRHCYLFGTKRRTQE
jgi:hypothetical protein